MICSTCGGNDNNDLLLRCVQCRDIASHRYCIEGPLRLDGEDIIWHCGDCMPKVAKVTPRQGVRKSERILSIATSRTTQRSQSRLARKNFKQSILSLSFGDVEDLSNPAFFMGVQKQVDEGNYSFPCVKSVGKHQIKAEEDVNPQSLTSIVQQSEFEEYRETIIDSSTVSVCTEEGECHIPTPLHEGLSKGKDEGRIAQQIVNGDVVHKVVTNRIEDHPQHVVSTSTYLASRHYTHNISAQPVFDTIWSGGCHIVDENRGITSLNLVAHMSTMAGLKVSDTVSAFPRLLNFEVVPRDVAFPKRFLALPPSDGDIALYFLPASERDERIYDGLLDKMVDQNILLISKISNDLMLLLLPSLELPKEHWRFMMRYYIWSVFVQHAFTNENQQIRCGDGAARALEPSMSMLKEVGDESEIKNLDSFEKLDENDKVHSILVGSSKNEVDDQKEDAIKHIKLDKRMDAHSAFNNAQHCGKEDGSRSCENLSRVISRGIDRILLLKLQKHLEQANTTTMRPYREEVKEKADLTPRNHSFSSISRRKIGCKRDNAEFINLKNAPSFVQSSVPLSRKEHGNDFRRLNSTKHCKKERSCMGMNQVDYIPREKKHTDQSKGPCGSLDSLSKRVGGKRYKPAISCSPIKRVKSTGRKPVGNIEQTAVNVCKDPAFSAKNAHLKNWRAAFDVQQSMFI
ncbi:hypothetical protein Dimus_017705 [Dionaea muscipula]